MPSLLGGQELDLQVHLAALEYSLANAIVIRDREDIQSTRHWSEHLEPFDHQIRNLITFCRRAPVALIADDVGLGKTISAGLILSELMTRRKVSRTLIVCPSILMQQWQSELKQKFGIGSVFESGRNLLQHLRGDSPVVITTYHTARDRIAEIGEAGFDMAILDEAHKLKSLYGQRKPAKMARVMKQALSESLFSFVLMLTATPIQNTPWDLYSLIDLLTSAKAHRNPLGSPQEFEAKYLEKPPSKGPPRLRPSQVEQFRHIIAQYVVRSSRTTTQLPFPSREVEQLSAGSQRGRIEAEELLAQVVDGLSPLQQSSVSEAMMSSHAAFLQQVQNMLASGNSSSITEHLVEKIRILAELDPLGPKFPALKAIIEEARSANPDFRIVVFTKRRATLSALVAALESMNIKVGTISGGQPLVNRRSIADFSREKPDINIIVSTDAGAEGVNLQVANLLVNYDLPWNPMIVEQRIGRVQRLGSTFDSVKVINLVVYGSIEEEIVSRLILKLMQVTNALGEMEPILEAAALEGDDGMAFQSRMRELVLDALSRKDTEESLRAIEADITRAKDTYKQEEEFVQETLGDHLSEMHSAGPALPELSPIEPRLSVRQFVESAFQADGASIQPDDKGAFMVLRSGEPPFRATFDPSDPRLSVVGQYGRRPGANVRLYDVGSPPFEQLVGDWASRTAHYTLDLRSSSHRAASDLVKAWVEQLDPEIRIVRTDADVGSPRFTGEVSIRATVGVAHDRLDRLITLNIGDPIPPALLAGTSKTAVAQALRLTDYAEFDESLIQTVVENDKDLSRFADFYEERLGEELTKADGEQRSIIARQNFSPHFAARVQAAHGVITEAAQLSVDFTVSGAGPYSFRARAAADRLIEIPETGTCAETGRKAPSVAFSTCAISGGRVLTHLLVRSAKSQRVALSRHSGTCEVTSKPLLVDELGTCTVSGQTVDLGLLHSCAVSGNQALLSHLEACALTGAQILPEYIATSEVSGRAYRRDQQASCVMSNTSGHMSEFMTCSETAAQVLAEYIGTCGVSGAAVRLDQLHQSEKNPEFRALRRLLRKCESTGMLLGPNEGARSSVSGKWVDKDLLVPSDKSGALALADELISCEVSGIRLAPGETGICADTQQRVDSGLLEENRVTGESMLKSSMQLCPESQAWGRRQDFGECESTGYLVYPALLVRCTATNKRVLHRLTVPCEECKNLLLRSAATSTTNGALAHAKCTQQCVWTGTVQITRDSKRCVSTGVVLSAEHLNPAGRASAIHTLLDDSTNTTHTSSEAALGLARELGYRPRRVTGLLSPTRQTLALLVQESQFLGFGTRRTFLFVDRASRNVLGEALSNL